MKILLSINKKAIALLLSFLVILSSFSLIYTSKVSADTTSRSTNTKMMYQDPFTASGSHIVSTISIAGTDIKKVHHDFLWDGERTEGIERYRIKVKKKSSSR